MFVRDYMSAPAVTIPADMTITAAMRLMQGSNMHHLPVADAEGHVVGMVTDRDLRVASMHYVDAAVDVESIMTREVITTTPETPLIEAARMMVGRRIGGLPVLDGEMRVVGVITETDVLKVLLTKLEQ